MKFSTWQLVAILAILMAAIVGAHVFAPGAAPVVIGMASTLFAALFVTHDPGPKDPPAGTGSPPALTLVSGVLMCLALVGCGASLDDLQKAASQGDNDAKLSLCRADARAAFYVGQKSEAEALAVYDTCVKKAGSK